MVGFLCDNRVIFLYIDDEVVSLKLNNNKVIDIDVKGKYSEYTNECKEVKEVQAEVVQLYSAKYYPRVYYSIYRVVIEPQPKIKTYLMERFDGTRGSVMFYKCRSFKSCLSKIDEFEED